MKVTEMPASPNEEKFMRDMKQAINNVLFTHYGKKADIDGMTITMTNLISDYILAPTFSMTVDTCTIEREVTPDTPFYGESLAETIMNFNDRMTGKGIRLDEYVEFSESPIQDAIESELNELNDAMELLQNNPDYRLYWDVTEEKWASYCVECSDKTHVRGYSDTPRGAIDMAIHMVEWYQGFLTSLGKPDTEESYMCISDKVLNMLGKMPNMTLYSLNQFSFVDGLTQKWACHRVKDLYTKPCPIVYFDSAYDAVLAAYAKHIEVVNND